MSFDWKKYLELAEYIYENSSILPDKEACYRTSVSRAYYAAFCIARRYLQESDGKRYEGGVLTRRSGSICKKVGISCKE